MRMLPGDMVTVRTYITGRKIKAKVLYVNHKHGWFTAHIKATSGEYNESFWIRDLNIPDKQEAKKKRKEWWEEDMPDNWLEEWSEEKYGR